MIDRDPWESVPKAKESRKVGYALKTKLLNIQEQAVPMCRKKSHKGKRPAWFNKEIRLDLRKKRESIVSGRKDR